MLFGLYQCGAYRRAAIVWAAFGVAALAYPGAFAGVVPEAGAASMTGIGLFVYIVGMNGLVALLIALGNLFARFGPITPGLVEPQPMP
jgi:hypothetical protein